MKSDEWKEVRLGDISHLSQGKQISVEDQFLLKNDGLNRFLRIVDYTSLYEPKRYVNENDIKYYVNKDDIVIIRYGSRTAGKVVKGLCGIIANNLFRVNFIDNVNKAYFYYKLSDYEVINYFKNSQSSSTMPAITFDIVQNLKISLPPLPEQKAIADTLSCIDDKIENNNRMNKVLEEMAQAIFKSWFIDFEPFKDGEFVDSELGRIPKGWRVGTLGEECECVLGGTPSRVKDNYWGGDIPWINSSKTNEFRIILPSEYITEEGLNNSSTSILPKKTIVLAITGATLGQFSILEIESCANQSVVGIKQNDLISYQYIYNTIFYNINNIINNQTGGAQQHINKGIIEKTKILIPINNILEKFNNITENIYESIAINCFENLKLSTLRDTLLPKLMSGEIRVPYEENTKEE